MRQIIFEKWKIINLVLILLSILVIGVVNLYIYSGHCGDLCPVDLIWGVVSPIFNVTKFFIFICIALYFVPAHIFKHWFLVLFPLFCLVMYLRLSTISINEYGGILQWSRPGMAEFGTIVFAIITAIFVIAHLIYDWKKKK